MTSNSNEYIFKEIDSTLHIYRRSKTVFLKILSVVFPNLCATFVLWTYFNKNIEMTKEAFFSIYVIIIPSILLFTISFLYRVSKDIDYSITTSGNIILINGKQYFISELIRIEIIETPHKYTINYVVRLVFAKEKICLTHYGSKEETEELVMWLHKMFKKEVVKKIRHFFLWWEW